MLRKLCATSLLILGMLTESNATNNTNMSKAMSDFYSKFHQTDYTLTFEWAEVVRSNKDYGDFKIRTFKYNRTCTAVNASFVINTDLGNDLEMIAQAYKFASNEYRLFPMRFEFNFCESIARNIVGLKRVQECGNFSCPILKGKYMFCNFTPDGAMGPPFVPTGKYMIEVQAIYRSTELFVKRAYMSVSRPILKN